MEQLYNKTLDYLKLKIENFTARGQGFYKFFNCPFCNEVACRKIISTDINYVCAHCRKKGTIIDFVRVIEKDKELWLDNDIIKYLSILLKVEVITNEDIDFALRFYKTNNFDLVPVQRNGKAPIECKWTEKNHTEIEEWKKWLEQDLNIGVKSGKISNLTIIDIDSKKIPSNLSKFLINYEGLIQESSKGWHYFFQYDSDLPKSSFNYEGIHIDIENDGGQVVIFPSVVEGIDRKILQSLSIPKISDEFKQFLKNNIEGRISQSVTEIINIPKLTDFNLGGVAEGNRNNFLTSFGGILRKELNINDTRHVLELINQNFIKPPLPNREIQTIVGSLNKYVNFEQKELAQKILDYLQIVEEASARDVKEIANENKELVDKALAFLVKEGYIIRVRRLYRIIPKVIWKEHLISAIDDVKFKVPYFDDVAHFAMGDMILLGGKTKSGKCLKNGYILTNQGILDIAELGEKKIYGKSKITKHIRVFSGVNRKKCYRSINYFWKEKVNQTIKIITDFGYELEGTPDHPILILNKDNKKMFKKLSELNIGDNIILMTPKRYKCKDIKKEYQLIYKKHKMAFNLNNIDLPKKINITVAKLMGYIIGDGHLEKNVINIYQNSLDIANIEEICNLFRILGIEPKKIIDNKMVIISIYSAKLWYYFSMTCFGRKNTKSKNILSPDRFIPRNIRCADKEMQIAFISALFNCESNLGKHNLEITMASEKIMKCLHVWLLNFGIISSLNKKKVKKYPNNDYWRISIPKKMRKIFIYLFAPEKYKKNVIEDGSKRTYRLKKIFANSFYDSPFYLNKIKSKEILNNEVDVYDFNIYSKKYKINNQFWSNGFISHNTHIAMNFVKQLVDQGIKPYYYSLESGSRFSKTALKLGLKEGDFYWTLEADPTKISFEKNSITVVDWLFIEDFSMTNVVLKHFVNQLFKTNGFLIIFAQLKQNNDWFAPNLITNFPALAARYIYLDENDGSEGAWKVDAIRDPKSNFKKREIPCIYDWNSHILKRLDEVQNGGIV